jgi:hypothetical protein
MSLGMIIPTVVSGIKDIGAAQAATMASTGALSTALSAEIEKRGMNIAAMKAEDLAEQMHISKGAAAILISRAKLLALKGEEDGRKSHIATMAAETLAEQAGITVD